MFFCTGKQLVFRLMQEAVEDSIMEAHYKRHNFWGDDLQEGFDNVRVQ